MPYCSYCGVEVDEKTVSCPLCGAEIPATSKEPPLFTGDYPPKEHRLYYPRRAYTSGEKRAVLWLLAFILAVPLTIIVVVDLYVNRALTWSIYPLVAFAGVWIVVALALFLRGFWKIFLSYVGLAVLLSVVFNLIAGAGVAILRWNLPILIWTALLTMGCAAYGRRVKRIGANLAAVIVWAIVLLCFGIDVLVTINGGGREFPLGWSLIVASALVPTGALLMYIHGHFGKTFSLRRYFTA
jgi:hypothetical protein